MYKIYTPILSLAPSTYSWLWVFLLSLKEFRKGGLRVWKTQGGFAGKTTWNENGLGFAVLVEFRSKPVLFKTLFRGFCWLGAIYYFEAFDIYKMLHILFYTFPGSDLTLNHMISISHLVLFTPRRNLTSFSSSIVLSNPAVLVPVICHVVLKHIDRPSPCSLSQSFPVTEGSVSLNLHFLCSLIFPKAPHG